MAQLVSRRQFFSLRGRDSAVLESESGFDYAGFSEWYAGQFSRRKPEDAYEDALKLLASMCPPVVFAGQGSSRAAFALVGGKCLKVAKNGFGAGQNDAEAGVWEDGVDYSCFAKVFASDRVKHSSLLTECCAPVSEDDFYKAFGAGVYSVVRFVEKVVDAKERGMEPDLNPDEKAMKWLADSQMTPAGSVLADLLGFYGMLGWNLGRLTPSELASLQQWGLAWRDGVATPVILDYGLNDDVFGSLRWA